MSLPSGDVWDVFSTCVEVFLTGHRDGDRSRGFLHVRGGVSKVRILTLFLK